MTATNLYEDVPNEVPGPLDNRTITSSDALRVMLDETARGNMFAFSCLYDELGTETYTLCMRMLGTRGGADRAAMEIWLRVWQYAAALTCAPFPARETILIVAVHISRWVKSNG